MELRGAQVTTGGRCNSRLWGGNRNRTEPPGITQVSAHFQVVSARNFLGTYACFCKLSESRLQSPAVIVTQ